ncbi:hypothetical protein BV898_02947 [Hypsibius exemplaris]|uniref:Uncharacterized protein n=1 Tax=Hypsibius exemplaris TaxID=2072580 RepID=A0A1W0X728_HYPEX|nr:hypothetical protein BV898_02947 [Hypsibius exemplaris]
MTPHTTAAIQMAEVNDLFIRSLRNSTRSSGRQAFHHHSKSTSAAAAVVNNTSTEATPSKRRTPSWLTGRHSSSGERVTTTIPTPTTTITTPTTTISTPTTTITTPTTTITTPTTTVPTPTTTITTPTTTVTTPTTTVTTPSTTVTVAPPPPSPLPPSKSKQTSTTTSTTTCSNGTSLIITTRPEDDFPPDLLANLTPRHYSRQRGPRQSQSSTTTDYDGGSSRTSSSASAASSTITTAKKVMWNPLAAVASRKSASPSGSTTVVVKEYQVHQEPSGGANGGAGPRRHSCAVPSGGGNPPPVVIESQVRVLPAWFPPANISRLNRQGSFHGETAASRLLRAKQRALFRIGGGGGFGGAANSSSSSSSSRGVVPVLSVITQQPQQGSMATTTTTGMMASGCGDVDGGDVVKSGDFKGTIVEGPERNNEYRRPPKPLKPDTYPCNPPPPSTICPRHAKHHNLSPLSIPKPSSDEPPTNGTTTPSIFAKKPTVTDLTFKSTATTRKPKSAFKFGTLPRSFKVSGTGRSSPAPLSALFRAHGSPTPFSFSTAQDQLRSAPPVLRRAQSGTGSRKQARSRNSWYVTTPVLRPDVALPEDRAWFDPGSVPTAHQKLCTCGDTRKHVHLVRFAADLTLTDTRYFVGENGTTDSEASPMPEEEVVESGEPTFISRANAEATAEDDSDSREDDDWGTIVTDDLCEELADFPADEDDGDEDREIGEEVLEEAVSVAHREIDAISCQDKSMLRKLLDMSDQIRHWNGSRKHRIRSVDSSPVMSQLNVGEVASNKSLGNFPSLFGGHEKPITEDFQFQRTWSMESFRAPSFQKGQVPGNAALAFRFAKNSTVSDISGSQLRTNVHLSYSDLLRNSSKFWQQPSQPGSFDPLKSAALNPETSLFVLREASLSLLL